MKLEKQRLKIAEVLGYPDNWMRLYDWPRDLNACHEMEKTMTADQCREYDELLGKCVADDRVIADSWRWHSTAAQRCEAFLKTLNLWSEEK